MNTVLNFVMQSTHVGTLRRLQILRAEHMGMCFGVRDAISLAKRRAKDRPVTILGELVHNESVLRDLRRHGVGMAARLEDVTTGELMISAHGASDRAVGAARERGFVVTEATCPLVRFAHESLGALVREGFHPVVIGRPDHVEVRGLTGDCDEFDVVLTEADVDALEERSRFGVVAQTTQPIERVRELVGRIRQRFPKSEVRFRDTVCQPTKQRQRAAEDLARNCDVVIVVGGANSNNTRELASTCGRHCARVHHVQSPSDLRAEWITGAEVIGLTAGTSTPDTTIDAVESELRRLAAAFNREDAHP